MNKCIIKLQKGRIERDHNCVPCQGLVSKKEISDEYLNSEDGTKNREKMHRNSENRYDCSIYENMFENPKRARAS